MRIISNGTDLAAKLASAVDPPLNALLIGRRDQLLTDTYHEYEIGELVRWVLVDPGDTLAAIEAAVGRSIDHDPPWEWVMRHGRLYEATIVLSDDGYGVILIVPDEEGIDPTLISHLRNEAGCTNPAEL